MSEPSSEFMRFLSGQPIRRIRKGQILLYQGEVPRTAMVIKEGVVKIYNISNVGEEKVVTFKVSGDMMPDSWLFGKSKVALYYYEAFTDCEVYAVNKNDLIQFIESNRDVAVDMLRRYVTQYVGATIHINALEHAKSTDKIAHTLQHLIIRFGTEHSTNLWRINLRLTHQDLANMIGLARETIAMELSRLKKRGVLSYYGQRYMIRSDKLQQLIGEDNFKDLSM
jgi:CRP/FNR family transcriptional regulator